MKVTTKSRTYTTAGRIEPGTEIEVDDKAGAAMLKAGIVGEAAAKDAEGSETVTKPKAKAKG